MNEIQTMFEQDVRDKKRAGSGVYHKTGKKGYVGKVKTPYDFMSSKEKRKLDTEVVSYSMYDSIMQYDEFKSLDMAERTKTLAEYLNRFPRKEIAINWGVKTYTVNNWVSQLGLSQPKQAKQTNMDRKEEQISMENDQGFSIKLIGSFKGKDIQHRLNALAQILIEDSSYEISFVINEKVNEELNS